MRSEGTQFDHKQAHRRTTWKKTVTLALYASSTRLRLILV